MMFQERSKFIFVEVASTFKKLCQVSPDGKSLICLYETSGYKEQRFLTIPLAELE